MMIEIAHLDKTNCPVIIHPLYDIHSYLWLFKAMQNLDRLSLPPFSFLSLLVLSISETLSSPSFFPV